MEATTSLYCDSTLSSVLNFRFYLFYCNRNEKDHIRRKINRKNQNIDAWNQYYYYFDLPKIRVGQFCTTKIKFIKYSTASYNPLLCIQLHHTTHCCVIWLHHTTHCCAFDCIIQPTLVSFDCIIQPTVVSFNCIIQPAVVSFNCIIQPTVVSFDCIIQPTVVSFDCIIQPTVVSFALTLWTFLCNVL